MDDPNLLQKQAINAALTSNWDEALKLNQQIIATSPENVDALNRLARAHFELGDLSASKKFYETALKHDPYNQIASKFLKRIETFSKKGAPTPSKSNGHISFTYDMFIEEPGKTKLVNLIKLAEPQKLSMLSAGHLVTLTPKTRFVVVSDSNNQYLGALPDDVSHRLLKLITGGNKYQAIIKTVKPNSLTLLIKEVYRAPKFKNQPSFLDNLNTNLAFSSDHIMMSDEDDRVEEDEGEEDSN